MLRSAFMRSLFASKQVGIATRHIGWVALGFFGMLLGLALVLVRVGAHRILDSARWYGVLSTGEQTIGWDGRITLDQVRFTPYGSDDSGAINAARVVIDAGGPLRLMRGALRPAPADRLERRRRELEVAGSLGQGDAPSVVPGEAELTLVAENISMGLGAAPARWLPWLDPSNAVLFAALGCGEAAGFNSAIATRAGDTGKLDVRLQLQQHAGSADVTAAFAFGGISTAVWQAELLPSSKHGLLASDWRHWQLVEQQWTLRDRGFVRARNRECARRLALPRPQFVARHALAVKRQMAAWNMALPAPLENAYREHASLGGEIIFESKPKRPVRLGEYHLMSRSQRVGALDAHITLAGRRLPLLLEFLPEGMPAIAVASAAGAVGTSANGLEPATGNANGAGDIPAPLQEVAPPAPQTVAAAQPVPSPAAPRSIAATEVVPPTKPRVMSTTPGAPAQVLPAVLTRSNGRLESDSTLATLPDKPVDPHRDSAVELPSKGRYHGLVGRRVVVTTTLGTARAGRIRVANAVAVTLEMQTSEGLIQLRIPAEQIVRVRAAL